MDNVYILAHAIFREVWQVQSPYARLVELSNHPGTVRAFFNYSLC